MRRLYSNALAATAIVIANCSGAAAQDASTREREALSSRAANRTVQRDLLSIFEPVTRIDSGMSRQLRGVDLQTRAFGTEFPGVCRRDSLILWYAATDQNAKYEDRPIRPYGVDSQAYFHIDHLPRKPTAKPHGGREVWEGACAAASRDEQANWFAAANAYTAVQGVLVLEAAVAAVRSGKLRPSPCPSLLSREAETCEAAIVANGDRTKIDSIQTCSATLRMVCYEVDLDTSTKLTITARAEEGEPVPTEITSIAIEQYIIVT